MATTVVMSEPETYIGTIPIIAQGDSWYSFGSIPPWHTGNVLTQIDFQRDATIVDYAQPGQLIRDMCTNPDSYFNVALTQRSATAFNAIMVSGGGNDVIAWLRRDPSLPATQRLLLLPNEWQPVAPGGKAASRYISPAGWHLLAAQIMTGYQNFADLRARSSNPNATIVTHTYDYSVPRPAGIPTATQGWMYPALTRYGIPAADWNAVSAYLIDSMADFVLGTVINAIPNMTMVDLRGTLTPAVPGATGPSNDWANEIHPTPDGYAKLALRFNAFLPYL